MSKLLKIGNIKIGDNIKEFFFDDCHKIYLIEDKEDKKNFFNKGWNEQDIHTIDELENIFNDSCPLRLISTCKLKTIVPQCRKNTKFTYDDHISYLSFLW